MNKLIVPKHVWDGKKKEKPKAGDITGDPSEFERDLGDDEEKPEEKPEEEPKEKAPNKPVTQEEIDGIDGKNKTKLFDQIRYQSN